MRRGTICGIAVGFLVFVVAGALLTGTASAALNSSKTVVEASPQETLSGMSRKAVRGISNAALGWIELPKQVYVTFQNEGAAAGLTIGPLKGIGMTLARALTGAAELATFFYPLPGFYDPFYEPEFVWQPE